MSSLGDIFNFQKYLGSDVLNKWKDQPERLFLGINTPLESKVWGGLLGKNYEPSIDMFGGNTENQARGATAKGVNTGPGEKMHDIARSIASLFAGGYGASQLGGLGGLGGAGAAAGPVQLSGPGYVGSGAAAGAGTGGAGAAASSASAPSWLKYAKLANTAMSMGGQGGGGQQQYGPPQHQFVGPENPYALMLRRMYG